MKYTMKESRLIQVLIVDDYTMVRRGLKILLKYFPEIKFLGEAANGLRAIKLVSRLQPDLVLKDIVMSVMDGIDAIQRIIAVHPDQHIIVLTAYFNDETFVQAVQARAEGYFVKDLDAEELMRAIRNIYHGTPTLDSRLVRQIICKAKFEDRPSHLPGQLSEKELTIQRMLTFGMTDQEIAKELAVTDVTVRTHISQIVRKLHLENWVQAVLYSLRSSLVPESDLPQMYFDAYEPKAIPARIYYQPKP